MQFQKGQNGNPAGRRRGACNPMTILAEQMLATHAQAIIRTTIEQAEAGNATAQRILGIAWRRSPGGSPHLRVSTARGGNRCHRPGVPLILPDNTGEKLQKLVCARAG
jgi:Family of unknown function (DUF5681)